MSDTKGQRCCEQGNFGELHDCAKGQPAESTASTFEEWWDENGIDYVPAGELGRPTAKELAQAGWQARGASEYERGPAEMYLCEINHLILHSDQPYIFRKHPDCYGCNKYLAHGTPAEHNPARAPHDKFASLWCDACPRPTSGTPAPAKLHCPICGKELISGISFCGTCQTSHAVQCVECPPCGYIKEEPCQLGEKPATPPPADETLPAGAPVTPDMVRMALLEGQLEIGLIRAKLAASYLNKRLATPAQPSGAQAAAPATTPAPKWICECGRHILEHGELCDE